MSFIEIYSFIALLVYLLLSYFVADKIGRYKTCGFTISLILCLLTTPFAGYIITEFLPLDQPPGCQHCGNRQNEAEYCGLCNKNTKGELRPDTYYKRKGFFKRHLF